MGRSGNVHRAVLSGVFPGVTLRERARGSLLAGACGDALGYAIEFLDLDQIHQRYGPAGITDLPPEGRVSDDTQMTLFTAEALLLARGRASDEQLHHAYLRWLTTQGRELPSGADPQLLREGELLGIAELGVQRAPGSTCLSALSSGRYGRPSEPINSSKGCGGVMRIAPCGIMFGPAEAFEQAVRAAAITHGHPSGYLSAGYAAALISALTRGASLPDSLSSADVALTRSGYGRREELESILVRARDVASSGPASAERVALVGAGWTGEECLAVAVYALLTSSSLEEAVVLAANHSGDSDSTAAVAGALAGALYGEHAIPRRWSARVELADVILDQADRLSILSR